MLLMTTQESGSIQHCGFICSIASGIDQLCLQAIATCYNSLHALALEQYEFWHGVAVSWQ